MIVEAAVCPGAPFLIPGVADAIAARAPEVVAACRRALSGLRNVDAVVVLTVGAAPAQASQSDGCRVMPPGTVVECSSIGRSDCRKQPLVTLPSGRVRDAQRRVRDPAVGTIVGVNLLRGTGIDNGSNGPPVTAVEIDADASAAAAGVVAGYVTGPSRVGVLVIADGAACHGDHAPGRRDDRAGPFDATLAAALSAASPTALRDACVDRSLAAQLLAPVEPFTVLAMITADTPPRSAKLWYAGAPFGVGYLIASWRWGES